MGWFPMSSTESISAKLRRWADDGDTYESPSHCIASKELCVGCPTIPCLKCENKLFNRIADEIDREIDELRESFANPTYVNIEDAVREVALGIDDLGSTKAAIDRYYLPRPLFEDGDPVYIGAEIDDRKRGKLEVSRICYTDGGFYFNNSRGSNGRKMKGITYRYGERVGRPKQLVLDAEGVPIEVGETLYRAEHVYHPGKEVHVYGIAYEETSYGYGRVFTTPECTVRSGWEVPENLTHSEPDSQERIDKDALKDMYEYWGCAGIGCNKCPALVDGKNPRHRYGVDWCYEAITLDLLRRQRELDGRDAQ